MPSDGLEDDTEGEAGAPPDGREVDRSRTSGGRAADERYTETIEAVEERASTGR